TTKSAGPSSSPDFASRQPSGSAPSSEAACAWISPAQTATNTNERPYGTTLGAGGGRLVMIPEGTTAVNVGPVPKLPAGGEPASGLRARSVRASCGRQP